MCGFAFPWRLRGLIAAMLLSCAACGGKDKPTPAKPDGHQRMLDLLQVVKRETADTNKWLGDREARALRPLVDKFRDETLTSEQWKQLYDLGEAELWLGHEAAAIRHIGRAHRLCAALKMPPEETQKVGFRLGVAYLRLAETQNCCARNTPGSCILPLQGDAVHVEQEGARGAIAELTRVARATPKNSPLHLGALWLLNIAHMTVGEWPDKVPEDVRLPRKAFLYGASFPHFANVAQPLGLNVFTLSGGVVADDFDNDGDLDLMVSTWETSGQTQYYRNEGDGTFTDRTKESGLVGELGGLNLIQADYDNDGFVDVLVLRGGWLEAEGRHPNSLLKNLGGGRFRDVTFEAGLGDVHYPTQSAGWADFDNDGDLDLYIGNETSALLSAPSQLFQNNGDGTFTDVAHGAGVRNYGYTKSVAWGDFDGDGDPDLYVSNLQDPNRFYRNNGDGTFTDIAAARGMDGPKHSFPAWFWDYDNDGNLDLYVSAYAADIWDLAAHALDLPYPGPIEIEMPRLWRNDGKGGFRNVSQQAGLHAPHAPMGANFGDLDNDGYPDFYLGTGYPSLYTVMPNAMYHNRAEGDGRKFHDVTIAGGFGHLQKGHAIAFADLDHDGDQDVFEQMGGAQKGDAYYDVVFENPGFSNHWIAVRLEGRVSNRSAIGARIKVVAGGRSIYKTVNSGGSFGANPLRQTIGIGKATRIERLEVFWPTTGKTQVLEDLEVDGFLEIIEGQTPGPVRKVPAARFGGGK